MAKGTSTKLPDTKEVPMYAFLSLAEGSASGKPKKVAGKGDPLATAKFAVIKAIDDQKKFLTTITDGGTLGKTKGGTKTVSTWFWQDADKWWTTLRYGQLTIELGPDSQWRFPSAEKLQEFYEAVRLAVANGDLDVVIGDLQKKRSASLTGRTGRKAAA